ncbi:MULTISPECIES: hypothetical protein [unclassified Solwaraspora]|uniref:hypothetical protein n=1 Tax=unclassified Solwaraspora TaxID=2627926 RepID=UPI00248BA49C|nr:MULTISPECIES: hypothetical protein [unclassified Solwaraspora]WBB95906.1 hypothetical protein O7553_21465 [Solwaraspora sp. WMMA2059]WBC20190.1 hypothetical protein O7543_25915 [Solwaraspora sp. WMMA2080]WJK32224.1 hypothetical protein O7610_15670 [Solwaraspora sp. WMMA2065]
MRTLRRFLVTETAIEVGVLTKRYGRSTALDGLDLFGALLQLPQPLRDLSPFTHLPSLPGGQVSAVPLVVLALLAAGSAAGMIGLRRRDLPVG